MFSNKHFKIDTFTANFEGSPALLEEYLWQVKRQKPEDIPNALKEDEEYKDFLD